MKLYGRTPRHIEITEAGRHYDIYGAYHAAKGKIVVPCSQKGRRIILHREDGPALTVTFGSKDKGQVLQREYEFKGVLIGYVHFNPEGNLLRLGLVGFDKDHDGKVLNIHRFNRKIIAAAEHDIPFLTRLVDTALNDITSLGHPPSQRRENGITHCPAFIRDNLMPFSVMPWARESDLPLRTEATGEASASRPDDQPIPMAAAGLAF